MHYGIRANGLYFQLMKYLLEWCMTESQQNGVNKKIKLQFRLKIVLLIFSEQFQVGSNINAYFTGRCRKNPPKPDK